MRDSKVAVRIQISDRLLKPAGRLALSPGMTLNEFIEAELLGYIQSERQHLLVEEFTKPKQNLRKNR
jgi:hypothetical protein